MNKTPAMTHQTSIATNRVRRRLLTGGAALATVGLPGLALAQAWPSRRRTIQIVAAQAPGSSNDTTARALAEYLTTQLGATVVVANKPGGAGMIAADAVARAAPDGYTFLFTLHSQLAQAPVLLRNPPIDPDKDLVPIGSYSTGVGPICVKQDLSVDTIHALIALAKARPVTAGNYSIGSGWQIMLTQLAKQTGAQFDIVHYKGTGQMVVDLMAGHIDVGAGSMIGMAPGIQRGMIRPIALVSGTSDNPLLPGLPTLAEAGFTGPAFEHLRECNMLLAPAGTSGEIVQRLANLIRISAEQSDKVRMVLDQLGVTETPLTGQDLKDFVARVWPAYRSMTRELDLAVN